MVFSSMTGWMQPPHFSFSPWAGYNHPIFLFSMGWMQPTHYSFLCGLDATSPFFFSPWAGCNQPVFLFSMGWMQPAHFSFLHGLDATSSYFLSPWAGCASLFFLCKYFLFMTTHWHTTLHHDCSIIADLFETQDNLHVLFQRLINNIMIAILACTSIQGSAMPQTHAWSTRCQCLLHSSGGGRAAAAAR